MYIETTVNINSINLYRLNQASIVSGQSKNCIVSSLLRRLGNDHEKMQRIWSRVRYQERDAKANWHRLHLMPRQDEYEFFLDMRKVFKCSVSCLIAYAIEKYLDEIMINLGKGADNYRYRNYMFSRVYIDGVVCWIQSWGVPKTIFTRHSLIQHQFLT